MKEPFAAYRSTSGRNRTLGTTRISEATPISRERRHRPWVCPLGGRLRLTSKWSREADHGQVIFAFACTCEIIHSLRGSMDLAPSTNTKLCSLPAFCRLGRTVRSRLTPLDYRRLRSLRIQPLTVRRVLPIAHSRATSDGDSKRPADALLLVRVVAVRQRGETKDPLRGSKDDALLVLRPLLQPGGQ